MSDDDATACGGCMQVTSGRCWRHGGVTIFRGETRIPVPPEAVDELAQLRAAFSEARRERDEARDELAQMVSLDQQAVADFMKAKGECDALAARLHIAQEALENIRDDERCHRDHATTAHVALSAIACGDTHDPGDGPLTCVLPRGHAGRHTDGGDEWSDAEPPGETTGPGDLNDEDYDDER